MDKVQKLQQALAEYGLIKTLDTRLLHDGILIVNYFDLKSATNAYNGLHEAWENDIIIEYNHDLKEQLSSINESPDSAGSDKSEECSDNELKARESLETTKEKLKQEYDPTPSTPTAKIENPPLPVLYKSISIPYISGFVPPNSFTSGDPHGSDTSFDNDALSEGIEVNYTRQFAPQPFPGIHSTPSTALHTESTNMDVEDSWSKPLYFDSPDAGNGILNSDLSMSENPQFLRTLPAKGLLKSPIIHTHTKSYDYALSGDPNMQYFQGYYGRYPEDQQNWYPPAETVYYPQNSVPNPAIPYDYEMQYLIESPEKPPGRAKFIETEESKAKYKIMLRDILSGKDQRTTLMIKNIPNKYNQKMLLQKIDLNHSMQYNFFYLPIDFKNSCNVGYAFINFINPLYILRFYEHMNAQKWEKFNSEKVCQLAYARIQGLEGLLEHFHCSSVMSHQVFFYMLY